MTAKEKAKELVDEFKEHSQQSLDQNTINEFDIRKIEYTGSRFVAMMRFSILYNAKRCALIAIEFAKENPLNTDGYNKYLQEVKQEIEKL
jgi:hypothetical protein